ncbi:GGDEF domain-containing protein [Hydrogenimonas sp.]
MIYDNTTMAYNYTYFVRHANGAIVNTRKNKSSISLLIIDIDQLEEINIKFGFPIGDKTLNIVCDAIKSSIRNDDIVGRFGGSGFFVLLNECDAKGTENVIRKIDNKLGTKQVTGMHDESISFSVKYSSSIARGRLAQLGTLIENAEEATQRIKKEKLFYMITDHNGYPVVLRKKPSLQTA